MSIRWWFFYPPLLFAIYCITQSFPATLFAEEALTRDEACNNPNIRPADKAHLLCDRLASDFEYFSRPENICPGYTPGLPAGFNDRTTDRASWNTIKETRVYLEGGGASMNAQSLKCFHAFFEAAKQAGLQPCVRAALRTPAHQQASCRDPNNSVVCGRAHSCSSNLSAYMSCPHVNGKAMDVDDKSGRLSTLLALARSSTGQSVGITKVGAGSADPWHIECGSGPSEVITGSGATNPISRATEWIRGSLYPNQSTQQPQQVITPTVSQPTSASQNPLSAFQEPQTIGGVSGQLTITPAATNTNLVADRLEILAFPTTTQTSGSATTVPLVVSGQQAAQLAAGQQATTTPTYTGQGSVSPSQSTFISGDLSWQGAPQPPQQLTGFQATLANVRTILERILALLTPFNARYVLMNGELHEH